MLYFMPVGLHWLDVVGGSVVLGRETERQKETEGGREGGRENSLKRYISVSLAVDLELMKQ